MHRHPLRTRIGVVPPIVPRLLLGLLTLTGAPALPGCGGVAPPADEASGLSGDAMAKDPEATAALREAVTRAINETSITYAELRYKYNEDLLDKLDTIEAYLADRPGAEVPRYMADRGADGASSTIPAEDEVAHYRETFRRWAAATGKDARTLIDDLKAQVAAFKPGERTHPEFQKAFSAAFDDWRKVEVEEMRERRNVELHRRAQESFAPYRETHPDLVKSFESMLDKPPYNLPAGAATQAGK